MFRPFLTAALLCGASLAPIGAADAGNFDGTWTGHAGDWDIKLVISGEKGDLTLACPTNSLNAPPVHFSIPVSSAGQIDTWLSDYDFARRHLKTQLPHFVIEGVSTLAGCPGGATTLTKG